MVIKVVNLNELCIWDSELIEFSDVAYATQNLHKSVVHCFEVYAIYGMYMLCYYTCSVHSWVSFSGFAEAYFDWTIINEYTIKLWLHKGTVIMYNIYMHVYESHQLFFKTTCIQIENKRFYKQRGSEFVD